MKNLLCVFKNLFNTEFIFPPIFKDISVFGVFSQKLPYPFNFNSLNALNSFKIFFPKQIHSTQIIKLEENLFSNTSLSLFEIEGDAVYTFDKNIFLGIRTADCVPILITSKNADFVASVHAGWRGSVNKILFKFLQKIIDLGIKSENILIAMGPHIKVCCYEVGDEVIEMIRKNFENPERFIFFKNKKIFLDLENLNYYQALECLIPKSNIWISKDCTYCLKDKYWSQRYHREKRSFQIALIGILK
ncbi:Multi-copper polyphenol oxidoreductase, laccase [Thermodesulfobacterium geofontis OPF15]|jgi:YfiH family protein|uniref:Purine nucleoside phosphorylase n=1 Tax=Thermodesulfobacterium geofontis (strain OPF15) TaxID=795359 RepID=F8C682_THEGP|nr:peptidoglycan editing factor PgeF [Thermodesulfobacterium geofontis]AEH23236.1 Multi-copper polyphenol oxidoreductase, laccase [Thermodesulfobacterium geofontis OPF15]